MFLGDFVTNPIHVAIIANGNGIDIYHAIFRENEIPPGELIHYKIVNSHFGKNLNLAGSGTGATLGYVAIDPNFMEMVGSKVTNQPVPIEMDQRKRNYLHPVAGSDAARIGAGIFTKAPA